jgi:hypothetical protein
MPKRHMDLRIDEEQPVGPIHDATPPLPVTATIRWNFDPRDLVVDDAWAMAWTREQVLVVWREPQRSQLTTVWLNRRQVTRRDPG